LEIGIFARFVDKHKVWDNPAQSLTRLTRAFALNGGLKDPTSSQPTTKSVLTVQDLNAKMLNGMKLLSFTRKRGITSLSMEERLQSMPSMATMSGLSVLGDPRALSLSLNKDF
jgi:hypothetical protein